ncbi:Trp operon repressor family [Alteribacillus persepolensis]|uniref:Trp operon repressor family n=1 Tax=Alteribacillus persepolensis TaxID=568899 RepID=A0A1G8EWY9_9BACI|nr:YerC/YecD family TrpR-related protein [Alteribacillus persepolensis]SDH74229.1 Trp operon repressor family [Alteribacillus persepolensis]
MNTEKRIRDQEQFFKAVLSLKNVEETVDFFEDLCSMKELEAFIQRFVVAERLLQGETYETIQLETNARTSLIFRVKKSLERENSCLRKVLERLGEEEVHH